MMGKLNLFGWENGSAWSGLVEPKSILVEWSSTLFMYALYGSMINRYLVSLSVHTCGSPTFDISILASRDSTLPLYNPK